MKFSAVAILSAAAAVSASPLAARCDEPVFAVSDFEAGCIPHSSQCRISFGVLQTGNGETTPVQCVALATSNGQIPEVADAPCTDSSRTFSVIRREDGLTLIVSQPVTPSSNQSGSHLLPSADFVTSTEPNAQVESYTGPTSFNLDA